MTKRMIAKYPGTCTHCGKAILAGNTILWFGRGRVAHANCNATNWSNTNCTNCGGSGVLWNNRPCVACDGTGQLSVQDYARKLGAEEAARCVRDFGTQVSPPQDNSGVEDRCCGDLAYEDACARACGL